MNEPARSARTGRSRRAIRPSGTVGQDETVLRSVHPAALVTMPAAGAEAADEEPALPVRSLDDGDLGWGGRPDDSNDDRLRQDVPPHW